MSECALTRWAMQALEGRAVTITTWPIEVAKGRHWTLKTLALTVGWIWMIPVGVVVMGVISFIGLVGIMWDLVSE